LLVFEIFEYHEAKRPRSNFEAASYEDGDCDLSGACPMRVLGNSKKVSKSSAKRFYSPVTMLSVSLSDGV